MKRPRALLLAGGLALALWGMGYGLWYAVAIEHQTLDSMGGRLADAFTQSAVRDAAGANTSLRAYAAAAFAYTRQVDVHSHWIGLAMLLMFFGLVFDNVHLGERAKTWSAWGLLAGAIVFPFGVFLQTMMSGPLPSTLAVIGAAMVTISLGAVAWGLSRRRGEGG